MMFNLESFIEEKARAVCFYIEGMLNHKIPYDEVTIFMWDTLEEWRSFGDYDSPISEQEQVIWHLFHMLKRWPEQALRSNYFLRSQLSDGVRFLQAKGPMLIDCAGVRP